ncbi:MULTISPECIES: FG-GAP-like repeat-containing protein [unclassified Streptomyces]|uniref:FG-GAP-like repeat-containing protein n=1 Tax=unclassified Streptomyces TaxID=2593676 RepID=UPI0009DF0897
MSLLSRLNGRRRPAARPAALGLAVLTALTAFTTLGPAATPAQAAPSDCPKGYFCAWKTDHATGEMLKLTKSASTLGSWDNQISAVSNRTNQWVCGYDEPGYKTSYWSVGVRAPDPAGTDWGYMGMKSLSSLKFVPTERECYGPAYPSWHAEPNPAGPSSFGNLNGDDEADLLARDKVGRLWFLPGDGSGKLIGGGWGAMNALTRHGDFSRDGKEDVIAREASTGKLFLYPGTGTGTFGTRKVIGTGGWNAMTRLTALGDLTGDNRADLLAVEKSTGRLYLYPGTSTGTLGARKMIGSGGWNSMNALTPVGDVTGDGKADLVAREASTGRLYAYPGRTGALGSRTLLGGGWNVMAQLVAVGDHGLDGTNDLVALTGPSYRGDSCSYEGCLLVYGGRGDGTFARGSWDGQDYSWDDMSLVF